MTHERLSNATALGVLSPDAISSSAYGTEQILVELLPYAGLAAFTVVLPVTAVILVILVLVTASYRQVVMAYTRAGGSYVVARENFGPRVAQVAAAALLIDYVVTVAVQTSAGTAAVISAIPALGPYHLDITVGIVVLLCYANLRGLREAGRPFAVPTYLFAALMVAMIVTGLVEAVTVGLPAYDAAHLPGAVPVHQESGLVAGATVMVLLRAFANGGSSLTGVEAISNTVSAFRSPRGANARKVLVIMAAILGFLVAGVSLLAYFTHATPYESGYPSVVSQEARAVFGHGAFGQAMFALIQTATALILYTGANTSFNGFPFLASFVAADRFLPRQLTKRGHRLVFSNGIIVLTVLAVVLLLFSGGTVTALVPFYAIGVFTGFAVAGYGMSRHHLRLRERAWRTKLTINLAAGLLSTVVVGIFAIAKFTEGAWLVVVVFPVLVFVLIRLNREYRAEAAVLERLTAEGANPTRYAHHQVFVLVSTIDLAVVEALRYGHSLRPDKLTALHFVIDAQAAERLRSRWEELGMNTALRLIDVPDRRIARAAYTFVREATENTPRTGVTVLLPRRSYAPLLGRLLHDRTADRIARVVSRAPHAAATIVPYDVQSQIRTMMPDLPEERVTAAIERLLDRISSSGEDGAETAADRIPADPLSTPIRELRPGTSVVVDGRLREVAISEEPVDSGGPVLTAQLADATATVVLEFCRPHPDLEPGQLLRVTGEVHESGSEHKMIMRDPGYRVLDSANPDQDDQPDEEDETS
ncbi:APC family permease [Amycolatopsis australiensis]|uniref:APC family permease n=1 Tax=Amycolatopsis australiensis TaxID=546364 RepID=UPI001C4352CB|nr:APC family permease [Amycolatopsis australiensis]